MWSSFHLSACSNKTRAEGEEETGEASPFPSLSPLRALIRRSAQGEGRYLEEMRPKSKGALWDDAICELKGLSSTRKRLKTGNALAQIAIRL